MSPISHIIGCTQVYKIKLKFDGTLDCLKARLVSKGFSQTKGIDYTKTFSPLAKAPTLKVIQIVIVSRSWKIRQLDICNDFLSDDLTETVYVTQPSGFVDTLYLDYVYKLHNAL